MKKSSIEEERNPFQTDDLEEQNHIGLENYVLLKGPYVVGHDSVEDEDEK